MTESSEPRSEQPLRSFSLPSIIVIFVLVILFLIFFIPLHLKSVEADNRVACAGNLAQLYKGMETYRSMFGRNRYLMPHAGDAFWTCLLGHGGPEHPASYSSKAPLVGRKDLFVCPSSGSSLSTAIPGGNMADYMGPRKETLPPEVVFSPLCCDKCGNHENGGTVLRYDGSISFEEGDEYTDAVSRCAD